MSNSDATSLTLKGQLIGDAPTFTTTSGDISGRALTSASTAWTPTTWTTGSDYNSPDISSVVQEIVDQGTWASGNDIAIIITGTGHRASQAYDTDPSNAAQLVVTYTVNTAPTFIEGAFGNWSFDEGSGDSVAEGAVGISTATLGSTTGADANDPTWTTGMFGQALQFDGVNDYVEVADVPGIDISGPEFSASLWVKPDRGPGTEDMFS